MRLPAGKMDYHEMLDEFYFPFHDKVEHTIENTERVSGERILGKDPKTGKQVSVRMARFGPVAQLTNLNDEDEKPVYAGLEENRNWNILLLKKRWNSLNFQDQLVNMKIVKLLWQLEDLDLT